MEKKTFDLMVELVYSKVQKKDTNYKRSSCPRERMLIKRSALRVYLIVNMNIYFILFKCKPKHLTQ